MSKGMKKVVGIVAAVAIPFAAPAILGALGASAALSGIASSVVGTIGIRAATALGSAAVGAALGAGTAAIMGQSVGRGALMGGIGGGIGGWSAGANAARTAATVSGPGGAFPTVGQAAAGVPQVAGAGVVGAGGLPVAGAAATAGGGGMLAQAASLATRMGVTSAMAQQALIALASGVATAPTDAEKRLQREYEDALRQQYATDQEGFRRLLAEAEGISPEDFQTRYFQEAQLQGIAATNAALENVNPRNEGAYSEIERQGLQDAALNASLAGSEGFQAGQAGRRAGLEAAYNRTPRNPYGAIIDSRNARDQRRSDDAAGFRGLITGITRGGLPDAAENPDDEIMRRGLADA